MDSYRNTGPGPIRWRFRNDLSRRLNGIRRFRNRRSVFCIHAPLFHGRRPAAAAATRYRFVVVGERFVTTVSPSTGFIIGEVRTKNPSYRRPRPFAAWFGFRISRVTRTNAIGVTNEHCRYDFGTRGRERGGELFARTGATISSRSGVPRFPTEYRSVGRVSTTRTYQIPRAPSSRLFDRRAVFCVCSFRRNRPRRNWPARR